MKNLFAALICAMAVTSVFAEGLGISSKVYADRFNQLAARMDSPLRLQSRGAKVTKNAKTMTVRMDPDKHSTVMLMYGADRSKMEAVTLFRELGGDKMQALEAMSSILLTSMAAFENPQKLGVADMTMSVCRQAMKESGKDFKQSVMGVGISCVVLANGVLMLNVS